MKRSLLIPRRQLLIAGASLLATPSIVRATSIGLTGAGKAPGGGGGFTPQGVNFSATTALTSGAALTGVADSKVGTISFWFRGNAGSDSATIRVVDNDQDRFSVSRLSSGVMSIQAQNAAGTNLMNFFQSASTFFSTDGWKQCAAFWNTATGVAQLYVNGTLENGSITPINDTIAYATGISNWLIPNNGLPGPFDIAELWFNPAVAFDLSVSANLQKFISGGNAVNLGTNGATPTGTSPAVFMSGVVGSWNTNKGTGGGFTVSAGSITAASSNPP